jgi:hypothetical protein
MQNNSLEEIDIRKLDVSVPIKLNKFRIMLSDLFLSVTIQIILQAI